MNDQELAQLLRSADAPKPAEEYWREFPKRVTTKLHWLEQSSKVSTPSVPGKRNIHLSAWASGLGLACLCVLVGIVMKSQNRLAVPASASEDNGLAEARKCYQELEGLFPNQLQAIVFDQQGPRLVLSPKADVPAGPPLYLKICGPKGCEDVVTFSGQHIQLNGESCEVLANGSGQVMLVGSHEVWTGGQPSGGIRLEARML